MSPRRNDPGRYVSSVNTFPRPAAIMLAKPIAQSTRGSGTSPQLHKEEDLLQRPGGANHKPRAYLSLTRPQRTVTMRE